MRKCLDCDSTKEIIYSKRCQSCFKRYRQSQAPLKECECGCKELIPSISFDGKPMRYKLTHHIKFNCREKKSNWKGGIKKSGIYLKYLRKHHKYCDKKGYIWAHRYEMELFLGRYLDPEEKIHHIDGNGHNNEISNLMLFPNHSEHLKYERPKDMSNRECGICGSKETYKRPDGHFVWFIKDNRYMCQKCRDRIRYDLKRKNIWRKKQ